MHLKSKKFFEIVFFSFLILIFIIFWGISISNKATYRSMENLNQINDYLFTKDIVSDKEIELVGELVDKLPPSLFNLFKEHNGRIIIVPDLKGKTIGRTEVLRNDDITIYIKSGFEFDALLHEFGHVYLHLYPKAMNQRFRNIYEQEAKSLVTAYYGDAPYYYRDKTEYFAQAFQTVLYLGGNDTQEAAPATFIFMSELIQELFSEVD